MPVHAAIAHLAVIIAPLTAFVALAYALRPAARRGMRWPLVIGSALSIAAIVWTAEVGGDLLTALKAGAASRGTTLPAEVTTHAHGSDVLFLAVLALGSPSWLWSGGCSDRVARPPSPPPWLGSCSRSRPSRLWPPRPSSFSRRSAPSGSCIPIGSDKHVRTHSRRVLLREHPRRG